MRWNANIIGWIVFFSLAALAMAYETFHPVSSKHQKQLTQEYKAIQHPSVVELIKTGTGKRPTSVSVYGTFDSWLSWDDIRQYYETELTRNGWAYLAQEDKSVDFQNMWTREQRVRAFVLLAQKEMSVYYQKGEYELELHYEGGEKKKDSYTYGVFLRWGEGREIKHVSQRAESVDSSSGDSSLTQNLE